MGGLTDFSFFIHRGLLRFLLVIEKEPSIFYIGIAALEKSLRVIAIPHCLLYSLLHLPTHLTHVCHHTL